jgi:hypothetical protein
MVIAHPPTVDFRIGTGGFEDPWERETRGLKVDAATSSKSPVSGRVVGRVHGEGINMDHLKSSNDEG